MEARRERAPAPLLRRRLRPVAELALGEFAIAHRMGEVATSNFAADMLDLRHRLPRVFTALRDLVVDLWVARKVAKLSRRLATERVALVDAAVAAAVHETPQRILAIAEAKVIEADLDCYAERVRTDARRKGVWLTPGRGTRA